MLVVERAVAVMMHDCASFRLPYKGCELGVLPVHRFLVGCQRACSSERVFDLCFPRSEMAIAL